MHGFKPSIAPSRNKGILQINGARKVLTVHTNTDERILRHRARRRHNSDDATGQGVPLQLIHHKQRNGRNGPALRPLVFDGHKEIDIGLGRFYLFDDAGRKKRNKSNPYQKEESLHD